MTIVTDYTAILSRSSWNSPQAQGQARFLSYSFETSPNADLVAVGEFSPEAISSFRSLTAGEQARAREALTLWENASGIRFFEVSSGLGDIRFSAISFDLGGPVTSSEAAAFAHYPWPGLGGDVFIDAPRDYSNSLHILLHEIGHALGFKHPFDGEITADETVGELNSVMSYGGSRSLLNFDLEAVRRFYDEPGSDGTQVKSWNWNPATETLVQVGRLTGEVMHGMGAHNEIFGRDGSDTIYGADAADRLYGEAGADSLDGGAGSDLLDGGEGSDVLFDGTGPDTLAGGAGADTLYVEGGHFAVDGGAGVDFLGFTPYFAPGPIEFDLAAQLAQGSSIVNVERIYIWGGDEGDTLIGGAGADGIDGGGGDDVIAGREGGDGMWGGAGFDQVSYAYEAAGVSATLNSTRMVGLQQELTAEFEGAIGSPYGDTLIGDAAGNLLRAMDGNDQVDGAAGDDDVNGNVGADVVRGGAGADLVRGGRDNDSVHGDAGDDPHVNGNLGDDLVTGGDGRDTIYGGQGQDRLEGDAGDDLLSGDLGDDLLVGGSGADLFRFPAGTGNDWVLDFNPAEGDRILLASTSTYTAGAADGQVIIILVGGGILGLAGVSAASFDAGWMVMT